MNKLRVIFLLWSLVVYHMHRESVFADPSKTLSVNKDLHGNPETKVLVELAGRGKTELLLKILGPQTNVNQTDESGTAPLHAAAKGGIVMLF